MKNLYFLPFLLCCIIATSTAQVAPTWVTASGSTGDDAGHSIALDAQGNTYITGAFTDDATFGATVLKSNGNSDIFVAKYSPSGAVLWAKQFGGTGEDIGYSIACEPSGVLVFTGSFVSTAYFANDSLKSSGGTDVFVGKLGADGSMIWIKKFGSSSDDAGRGITIDDKSNYYITGAFTDKITFPGAGAGTITSAGGTDIFLAKYSSTGEAIWANRAGGISFDEARSIAFDKNGFVDIAGFFWGTASFPGGTATDLTSAGNYDCVVAQYDLDGKPQWARKAGGFSDDEPNSITVDDTGTVFVTGFYTGTATFSTTVSLKLGGMFLAKYTIDGFSEGAVRIGNSESDMGRGISFDKSGNVYVIGSFYGKTDFGLSNIPDLTSAGGSDIIVCCYNYDGDLQWARRAGGTSNDNGHSIVADSKGDVFVTGSFRDAASFPGGTIKDIPSLGGMDVFVGKYSIPKYSILGFITLNDEPLEGVSVSDGLRTGVTGKDGIYTINDVPNGSYTVTPSKVGYIFQPAKLDVLVKDVATVSVDFKALVVLIAPELILPVDKALNVPTSITFSWNPSISAKKYRLQVATSSIFTTVLVDDSTLTATSSIVSTLGYSTDYYWRVASSDGSHWSDWSASRRFSTETEVPGKVSLASPTNESVNIPISTNLIWKTVQGAELYHYQLSTVADFSTLSREDSLLIVVLKPISNLSISTKYYWRTRAKIGGIWGLWSNTWSFTTSNTVGVETPEEINHEWSVAPNPSRDGILTLQCRNAVAQGRLTLQTLLGTRVLDMSVETSGKTALSVDISGLAAGIYRCSIQSGSSVWSENVVIIR